MAQLLDLPTELLVCIFKEVGGRQLRRNVSKLTVSKKWFYAAHAVYLSGLDTSSIQIFGCDIDHELKGKWSYSGQRLLMHKNTRALEIVLPGHWWDSNHKEYRQVDGRRWAMNETPTGFSSGDGRMGVRQWQKDVLVPAVDDLFGDLSRFEALECVSVETLIEPDEDRGPQWEYINSSTIANLLRNLPLMYSLRSLWLDLCSGLNYDEINDAHICEEVAQVLPRIEDVRIRLRLICPDIFEIHPGVEASDVRLRSLIIKLYQPEFGFARHHSSKYCNTREISSQQGSLNQLLINAAEYFLSSLPAIRGNSAVQQPHSSSYSKDMPANHGMEMFRISYDEYSEGELWVVDCLTKRKLEIPYEMPGYNHREGSGWFEAQLNWPDDDGEPSSITRRLLGPEMGNSVT